MNRRGEYMILYTKGGDKVKCIKLKQLPKINHKNDYWDNFERNINDQKTKFWFTVRTNRCYFYFVFQNEWYKTDMSSVDGVDLWHYLQEMGEELYESRRITK